MALGRQVGMLVACKRSAHHGHHPLFEDCAYCAPEDEPTQPIPRVPAEDDAPNITRWCTVCACPFLSTNPFASRCYSCP